VKQPEPATDHAGFKNCVAIPLIFLGFMGRCFMSKTRGEIYRIVFLFSLLALKPA
jgi:hypothetical protein